jgi:hypothetical protein
MPVDVELELADGSRVRKTVETRNRVTVVPFSVSLYFVCDVTPQDFRVQQESIAGAWVVWPS